MKSYSTLKFVYEMWHGALKQKEMNSWNGPKVKHVWNNTMHVLHIFWVDTNTAAFRLGQYSLHLLLLMSSMLELIGRVAPWMCAILNYSINYYLCLLFVPICAYYLCLLFVPIICAYYLCLLFVPICAPDLCPEFVAAVTAICGKEFWKNEPPGFRNLWLSGLVEFVNVQLKWTSANSSSLVWPDVKIKSSPIISKVA